MRIRTVLSYVATLILLPSAVLFAGEPAKGQAQMDPEEMMAIYMQAATPGAHHEILGKFVGTFRVSGQMWMAPGAEPVESSGTSEARMIFGGRYLEQQFSGNFMGMPFEGVSITGYDNVKKQFVGTWIDSMGTGIMTSTGSIDESGRVLSFTADYNDPLMGPVQYDEKITIVDDDNHVMEMSGPSPDGTRYKMMELRYTRVD
jgi:hypothetical protein